jgi:hypothetical protein
MHCCYVGRTGDRFVNAINRLFIWELPGQKAVDASPCSNAWAFRLWCPTLFCFRAKFAEGL